MRRYYYVSNNLDDLDSAARDLMASEFTAPQIHVLSQQEAEIEKHHLPELNPFAQRDIVQSGIRGAAVGLFLALLAIVAGVIVNASSAVDWLPFVALAIFLFGFSAWEGGLYGVQVSSKEYQRFMDLLSSGYHVLLVDADMRQVERMRHVCSYHPTLSEAGEGKARPAWLIASQNNFHAFVKAMP